MANVNGYLCCCGHFSINHTDDDDIGVWFYCHKCRGHCAIQECDHEPPCSPGEAI